jgi:hypothetical protein
VLSVLGVLDRDATNALVVSINAAIATDSCVLVQLDAAPAPVVSPAFHPRAAAGSRPRAHLVAVGPGLIEVPTASGAWTVDVNRARVCTSHAATDHRFVPPQAWRPIRSLSVSGRSVVAVGAADDEVLMSGQLR